MSTSEAPDLRDNPALLCQDMNYKLFMWFVSRIDWKRILKEMSRGI